MGCGEVYKRLEERFGEFYEHPGYWVESVKGYRVTRDWYVYVVKNGVLYRSDIVAVDDGKCTVNISDLYRVDDWNEIKSAMILLNIGDLKAVQNNLVWGGINSRFV